MDAEVGALGRHIALIGFMGAGKSRIGARVAERVARPFVDLDALIERRHVPIPELFRRGEAEFRRIEEETLADVLAGPPCVVALGGGAVVSPANRERLRARAFTVYVHVDVETAWARVRGSDRPLAQREDEFRRLYESRRQIYADAAAAAAIDADGVLLASLAITVERGARVEPDRPVAVVVDERVLDLHPPAFHAESVHAVPPGERAKALPVVERLWRELRIGRDGAIVGLGGGSTTDVAGFVAATWLRGIPWLAVPTTLTGQVDAAIGGKCGIDLEGGKNLVGAFHFPERVVADPDVLGTLPAEERRAGMAEVVKTGLLAGRELWDLPDEEMIRACAAYKAGVVLSDPRETEGRRAVLNLGHTFAHALEAGSGYEVSHGRAVALGLLAALRLSGLPTGVVEEVLRPEPVRADPAAARAALARDKKGEGVFVLLEEPGRPVVTTVPEAEACRALESLIAK
ncbi:MAG TPA: bifunctional shikimate kinase/3-dehydroquinate synthase [Gaiellaceae bacterium]|nr:bifunctional shikimate kinase/3-dehydroquinate synthase [Gaiellaceae bacterium]